MSIIIHDVGMRDGLQNEKETVPTQQKINWIQCLIDSKVPIIQIGSFVHPKIVPQMADSDELFRYYNDPNNKPKDVMFSGLVLNERGFERGLACGVDLFCIGSSASETHSKKNTGMTSAESTKRIAAIGKQGLAKNKIVQAHVQSAFGCGFEGPIKKESVLTIIKIFLDAGITTLGLADTSGHAHPDQVLELYGEIANLSKDITMTCHFHNTYGTGIANCFAAYKAGVIYFESAFGGLGGCPFTAISSGNVCTEDLIHVFQKMNLCNNIDLEPIVNLSREVGKHFKHELSGCLQKIGYRKTK